MMGSFVDSVDIHYLFPPKCGTLIHKQEGKNDETGFGDGHLEKAFHQFSVDFWNTCVNAQDLPYTVDLSHVQVCTVLWKDSAVFLPSSTFSDRLSRITDHGDQCPVLEYYCYWTENQF